MKKLSQSGIGHHLVIVGIAVLVVATIGFAGYRVYKGRNIDAQAGGWTKLASDGGATYFGCKRAITGGYGPVWEIKTYINNSTGAKTAGGDGIVYRGNSVVNTVVHSASKQSNSSAKSNYASRVLGDVWSFTFGSPYGGSKGDRSNRFTFPITSLKDCP